MAVAAIIVGNDESQILETRQALANQSQLADFIFNAESLQQAEELIRENPQADWVWVLQAGMLPLPNALAGFQQVLERSPSATWLAPKLVRADRPREIEEYGLTVTRAWAPISPVTTELDQAQHDHREDFLAASVFGSLLERGSLLQAGGFSQNGNQLSDGYRLAISMRLNGHRVLGAPSARVGVQPGHGPFASTTTMELRKSQIQLLSGYINPALTLLGGLLAPLASLLLSVWLVIVKRPERIGTTLATGFWWFGNGFVLLAKRPKLSVEQRPGLKALRILFATREDIQRSIRSRVEQPAAIAEANLEATDLGPRFVASGGVWYMLVLAALSWQFWPQGNAVLGGGALPLGNSLAQLFSRAGASWQPAGFGLAAPSDPFNWVLFALGSLTFWAPSLSLAVLLFLAKPLAFAAAWRLLSLVSQRSWVLVLGALAYAFWPALSIAQNQGRIGTTLALVLLPLFVFTLARILQFGASPRRSVQTWTWVGTSALLAAVISASAPSLTPLVALVILLLAVYRFKRIGYLIWLPIPLLVIWIPFGWYLAVNLLQPAALLSDPGNPVQNAPNSFLQLALGGYFEGPFAIWLAYATAIPLALALVATLTRRGWNAMWLWLTMVAAVAAAFLLQKLQFVQMLPPGQGATEWLNGGSPLPLLGLSGLVASVLLVQSLDANKKAWRIAAGVAASAASLALAAQFTLTSTALTWTDGARMPALVLAQAAANPDTTTVVLQPQASSSDALVTATLVHGSGVNLQDLSTAYNLTVPSLAKSDARYAQMTQLAANLISANGSEVEQGLKQFGIDYVLIPSSAGGAEIAASLDTVAQLEPVGVTDFGHLYRVKSSQVTHQDSGWDWSVTKQVQVAVLALFALLAIPTRRRAGAANVQDEGELDAFEPSFEGEAF